MARRHGNQLFAHVILNGSVFIFLRAHRDSKSCFIIMHAYKPNAPPPQIRPPPPIGNCVSLMRSPAKKRFAVIKYHYYKI